MTIELDAKRLEIFQKKLDNLNLYEFDKHFFLYSVTSSDQFLNLLKTNVKTSTWIVQYAIFEPSMLFDFAKLFFWGRINLNGNSVIINVFPNFVFAIGLILIFLMEIYHLMFFSNIFKVDVFFILKYIIFLLWLWSFRNKFLEMLIDDLELR